MPRSSIGSTVREGDGSSTSAGSRLEPGVSRVSVLRELLAKHEEPDELDRHPVHRYWDKQRVRPCKAFAVQEQAARRLWPEILKKLGLTAVFVVMLWPGTSWAQKMVITSSGPRLTPQQAADILRPNQYVAPPTCERCDGPYIVVVGSTPGAAYWMPMPPEAPRRRLDGTLLDSRPPDHFWSAPVLSAPRHRR